jgi:hypothetical protein
MNIKLFIKTCLITALMVMTAATTANAQTNLQAQLVARPLTPGEIANTNYAVPANFEPSGGLINVGVGQPVYLEVDVATNSSVPNVTNITWALAQRPVASAAVLQASPLGTNVPVYEPSDRLVYQVAGRMLLRPDVAGFTTNDLYVVTATIYTSNQGSTNLALTITAGTYMGVGLLPGTSGCALCHSGGQVATNMVAPWELTAHSTMFANGIDGVFGSHYSANCIQCHTVGYDTNANPAANNGFNEVAAQLGWTFPTNLVASNWSNMEVNYPTLANLANIQCENCHGPGSQHMDTFGKTNLIAISFGSGDCTQCHDDPPNHVYAAEWYNSVHAVATRDPAGKASCVGCHTAYGFIGRIEGWSTTNTAYMAINCQTCHEPHGATLPSTNAPNPHIIRTMAAVTLMDGTVVTNAGEGLLCMECHRTLQDAATYASTTGGSAYFGPGMGSQADMLEGVNGFTYGLAIPSSAHASAVTNTCVACHMQTIASTDPAYLHAGGHTFENSYNGEDLVGACQQCHGSITNFDFPVEDFDGSGVVQGVQTQVQSLLNELSTLLPPVGTVKTSLSINSSWTQPQLEAAYNWLFVNIDGSLGVHNTAYAVGLLQASIANLTGVSVPGGLPDAWVIQYFGTVNNPAGAPNAINNTNGVPNWMMYALGLNPTQSGISVPGGVVWADGKTLVNSGATNTIAIYTAAEIAFNTQIGNTYQIQGISSLSGGWQNIGSPVVGTGNSFSYLTETRTNAQMFFRVVTNP